jgi:CRAL/TRIO domain
MYALCMLSWTHPSPCVGRPIVIGFGARHRKGEPSLEDKLHHAIGLLVSAEMRCGDFDGFTIICDLRGLGWGNVDYAFTKQMIEVLELHFPERLGAFFVVNSGWLFTVIWKVIRVSYHQHTTVVVLPCRLCSPALIAPLVVVGLSSLVSVWFVFLSLSLLPHARCSRGWTRGPLRKCMCSRATANRSS